ncbi:MAG: sulfite dehydrogenase [Acidobacteria bacterium]|nr:MAG: sulfite dehydrogenase [Acidobacteriota bacterium]PYR20632.1 MAG: sulfite dehydrogenase [Acidobacteriota bacterium]
MKVSRRALLAGAAGVVALGKTAAMQASQAPSDPSKVRGKPSRALGQRAPFEKPQRQPRGVASSGTPHQDLYGTITPADLHFERHHGGVPEIDPKTYSLLIHGMVERPMVFTLADLKRFPSVSRVHFLECSGNFGGRGTATELTPQQLAGLTSTSEWTGVALATLFREVGASPKATWFLAEGQDAAVLTRSIPVSKAHDDALIAYGQNGEAIRPEQGYPARLLLPGWEGNSNVKWLRRIELSDRPFMTREETSKYTEPMADGTARIFSFLMDARSLITYPAYPVTLSRGWVEINGIAWTGSGKIRRVDVSTDGGATWTPARLQEPVLSKAHTRFRHLWNWTGGEAVIMSRAVDETGYVQPTRDVLIAARGVSSVGYHVNPITGWLIRPDGTVVYRAEPW